MKEAIVLKTIMEYLAAKRLFAMRVNSGMQFGNHNGKKWAIHMAAPGTADIQVLLPVYDGRGFDVLWLEVKNEKGKQSDLQKGFEKDVLERGHRYAVVRSIDDVEAVLL